MNPLLPRTPDSKLSHLDDESIAEHLSRGHEEALTVLYERHGGLVLRIARRILGDDGEAEETVQDVFLEIYRRISHFDAQRGSFTRWLVNIAKSRSIDRKRHLRSSGIYELTQIDEGAIPRFQPGGPAAPLSQQEMGPLLNESLKALPAREQKVIKLYFFHGLTLKEVSQELGASLSVVRHLYYGGLNKLHCGLSAKSVDVTEDGGK